MGGGQPLGPLPPTHGHPVPIRKRPPRNPAPFSIGLVDNHFPGGWPATSPRRSKATDAAGTVATAKRTITLVKDDGRKEYK